MIFTMKSRIYTTFFRIILVIFSALPLTGCGVKRSETAELSGTDTEESQNSDSAEPDAATETSPTFPETTPYIDDTGKAMQRDGDYLYCYCDGRLMRTHTKTGETTLLYETAPTDQLRFCLSEDVIYFVERKNYDSLDCRDTSLFRIQKDGGNLTLLQDDIANAYSPYLHWYKKRYQGAIYEIAVYENIIYLMYYNDCEICYRLENDSSVTEVKKADTLFGKIPAKFSPSFRSDIPNPVSAMRNYGYLFLRDSDNLLYRMDPVGGAWECLGIDINSVADFAFFHNRIFLEYKSGDCSLFNLSDKSEIRSESLLSEAVCENIFSSEKGLFHCDVTYKKDSGSDREIPCLFVRYILPDGSSETLHGEVSAASDKEPAYVFEYAHEHRSPYWDTKPTVCFIEDSFYCFAEKGTEHFLLRVPVGKSHDTQVLASWTTSLTSSPSVLYTEKKQGEMDLGNENLISYSMEQLYLDEQTDADKSINQTLLKIYSDFEREIDDTIQRAKEYDKTTEYTEYTYHPDDVLSLSVFCNYMDDDTIAFDCYLSHLFGFETKGSRRHEYYVFDRHTGNLLTFEDLAGDSGHIISVAFPYVERLAEWEIPPEIVLEPRRFYPTVDGYALYFARDEIREDRDEGFMSDSFYITVPFDAFVENPQS